MNKMPLAAVVAVVLSLVAFFASPVTPQGGDPAPEKQALDDASLNTMLSGLGYEPKKLTNGFLISAKRDDWTFYIQFVLSSDKSRLGMNANLGSVPDPDSITAKQWMDLMIQNGLVDPSNFYFDATQKKLYMHRVLENRSLTAAYVRLQIDNFCANMKSTADYWKFVK